MIPYDPQRDPHRELSSIIGNVERRAYSPVQILFLTRLLKLLRDKREWSRTVAPEQAWRTRLIVKAIYSTYCDCVELGVGKDARQVLEQYGTGRRVSP